MHPFTRNHRLELVFSAKPRVSVFSCVCKFLDAGVSAVEWCTLYSIPVEDFNTALAEVVAGDLRDEYLEWFNKPEEEDEQQY